MKTQVDGRDVFTSYCVGDEAYASIPVQEPSIVLGPVVGKLMRFHHIGWKTLMGWGTFREECSRRIRSAAELGDNSGA